MYPVLQQLLKKYPDDLNLIIKHFPLRSHPFAEKAALASLSAAKQGKHEEVSAVLLKNYNKLNDETINKYAEEAGLDMEVFKKERDDPSLRSIIREDVNLGRKVGVRGVPALYINGRLAKKRTINDLSQMVEQELQKKKSR